MLIGAGVNTAAAVSLLLPAAAGDFFGVVILLPPFVASGEVVELVFTAAALAARSLPNQRGSRGSDEENEYVH